ncbi:MAG: NAD(P)/FAD-dependent oxidoreductase [Desulfuromonadales bacterium]|nr:NAD(P)/FAD-dependent oxidoreductase [Desulfuromonadales bacterium]
MERCEVLVVGGGPAGSVCAGKLVQAGLDVLLLDREVFPRPKPCAGWITPPVLEILKLDPEEYGQGRVLQAINAFRTGLIHGAEVCTRYDAIVSFGIRRYEFDHFLLQRSGVRRILGEPVFSLERHHGGWLVNGSISARLLVGAGGHFCPVARLLGAPVGREDVVVAQVAEFAMNREQQRLCRVPAETPALYFCRDMKGYGWLFRKEGFLNVGLGRMDRADLSRHRRDFCTFIGERWGVDPGMVDHFQGHAYRVCQRRGGRTCVGDGALLVGDAAGLAHPQSGEGILPAIESALLAADTILAAGGDYRRDRLEPYAAGLTSLCGGKSMKIPAATSSSAIARFLGSRLLCNSWFARHVVLERWFLHTDPHPA